MRSGIDEHSLYSICGGSSAEPARKFAFYSLKSSRLKYIFLDTTAAKSVLVQVIGF